MMTPAADDALREEVRLLGGILGEVIRDEGGEALFDHVEAVRQASIAYHRDPASHPAKRLEKLLAAMSVDQAAGLAHGFALFSLLANIAEDRATRRRAQDQVEAGARADTPEQIDARRLLIERVGNGELEAVLAQVTPNLLHPDHRDRQDLIDTQIRMGRDVGPDGFIRQEAAITKRIDSRPYLADIKVPTLVLVGDRDPLTPPDRAQEIAAAIPGADLVVIPDCGHASTLEQPEAVSAALVEWVSA